MFAVILCTSPRQEAGRIARALVDEKLVACVNVGEVNSYFRWEGEVQEEGEALLIMKTKAGKVKEIIGRIRDLHSYEVPEIIALPIIDGHEGYLDWVRESVE
ncbi:divalent-cation tolerance protein CutA [Dehalococcoidia bacterium]|nr:divalent-cation tolerance protein CutA [Dehalococcoidia bacterium]